MFRYRFFKHGNDWRFIERGSEKSEHITTFALEGVLGVVGGPEVRVRADQPDGRAFYVTIKNGFIDKVEYLYEENAYYDAVNEQGAYIATRSEEQTEFWVKNGV
jgi:hypothetical protein